MANSQYAVRQLARKLKLEATFQPELMAWFRSIGETLKPVIRHTGQLPALIHFRDDLNTLLRKHYARTGREFMGDVADTLLKRWQVKQTADEQQAVSDAALAAFLAWSVAHAQQQSTYIIETTQTDLQDIFAQSKDTLAQEEDRGSMAKLAAHVAGAFAATYSGRASTIATVETQTPAEQAKRVEADAAEQVAQRQSIKIWHTILDEKTRIGHVLADLQEQPRGSPFIVSGERLMVPGDTSLGASLSNIIGCRCSAEYTTA